MATHLAFERETKCVKRATWESNAAMVPSAIVKHWQQTWGLKNAHKKKGNQIALIRWELLVQLKQLAVSQMRHGHESIVISLWNTHSSILHETDRYAPAQLLYLARERKLLVSTRGNWMNKVNERHLIKLSNETRICFKSLPLANNKQLKRLETWNSDHRWCNISVAYPLEEIRFPLKYKV